MSMATPPAQPTDPRSDAAAAVNDSVEPHWRGLGFGIDELRLTTSFEQVSDVVQCGPITSVPRTRPWLRGITNVRGTICSVVDLSLFLGRAPIVNEPKAKLLVAGYDELQAALLVSHIFGLKHFHAKEQTPDLEAIDLDLRPFVDRAFIQQGIVWAWLDISVLTADSAFQNIAVES